MTTFASFQKFYEFISNNSEIREKSAPVADFCDAVEKINVGCGCQKKSRIARASRYYLSLAHELAPVDKELIKTHSQGQPYKLLHNKRVFLSVE